jgi:predicted nuclease of restriction endonuclease-like (RecB) superfamily
MTGIVNISEYRDWLRDLKQQIKTGQIKAALSVNSQMIMLYWDLGRQIAEKQEKAKWGSRFIEQLSKDLREEFPKMKGFSRTNLFRMKMFYQFYLPIIQQNEVEWVRCCGCWCCGVERLWKGHKKYAQQYF